MGEEDLWAIPGASESGDSDATKERLIEAAEEVWNDLEVEFLATLSDTTPNRVDAVREAKGWYTKY